MIVVQMEKSTESLRLFNLNCLCLKKKFPYNQRYNSSATFFDLKAIVILSFS